MFCCFSEGIFVGVFIGNVHVWTKYSEILLLVAFSIPCPEGSHGFGMIVGEIINSIAKMDYSIAPKNVFQTCIDKVLQFHA